MTDKDKLIAFDPDWADDMFVKLEPFVGEHQDTYVEATISFFIEDGHRERMDTALCNFMDSLKPDGGWTYSSIMVKDET